MSHTSANPADRTMQSLAGRRVLLAGKLAGMPKREAQRLVREHGRAPVEQLDASVHLLVVGEGELPLDEPAAVAALVAEAERLAAAQGTPEVVPETELWRRLGLVDIPQHIRRLYTPAMLADLVGVPLAVVRRWERHGLIVPARRVSRLAYFDFQEVTTARRLAELLAAGVTPQAIERQLAALRRVLPGVERPLAQLSVIVQGKQILLRQGDGLIDPRGQRRIDFEAAERDTGSSCNREPPAIADAGPPPQVLSLRLSAPPREVTATAEEMLAWAAELEDAGQLPAAAEMCRALLAAGGPRPEVCFRLAELLYQMGEPAAARERYFMAIELDEDYVEARANLGCVLAELGDRELAAAAFQGALALHPEYPDAHYHLARTLDELDRPDEARPHWQSFLDLAPDSPWAAHARRRLAQLEP